MQILNIEDQPNSQKLSASLMLTLRKAIASNRSIIDNSNVSMRLSNMDLYRVIKSLRASMVDRCIGLNAEDAWLHTSLNLMSEGRRQKSLMGYIKDVEATNIVFNRTYFVLADLPQPEFTLSGTVPTLNELPLRCMWHDQSIVTSDPHSISGVDGMAIVRIDIPTLTAWFIGCVARNVDWRDVWIREIIMPLLDDINDIGFFNVITRAVSISSHETLSDVSFGIKGSNHQNDLTDLISKRVHHYHRLVGKSYFNNPTNFLITVPTISGRSMTEYFTMEYDTVSPGGDLVETFIDVEVYASIKGMIAGKRKMRLLQPTDKVVDNILTPQRRKTQLVIVRNTMNAYLDFSSGIATYF